MPGKPADGPRARMLLQMMRYPDTIVPGYDKFALGCRYQDNNDPQWFFLLGVPNVGRKTINELIAAGVIEGRESARAYPQRWYRLTKQAEYGCEFGDLWIE